MKSGIENIIGKTVSNVVVADKEKPPYRQVFLVFSDNTYFELYGKFTGAGGVDRGGVEDVIEYAEKMGGKITDKY